MMKKPIRFGPCLSEEEGIMKIDKLRGKSHTDWKAPSQAFVQLTHIAEPVPDVHCLRIDEPLLLRPACAFSSALILPAN
jgi:hypothetical protein